MCIRDRGQAVVNCFEVTQCEVYNMDIVADAGSVYGVVVIAEYAQTPVAETGWAKASWGKIYGQWLCGSAVMVYDFDKFSPGKLLSQL